MNNLDGLPRYDLKSCPPNFVAPDDFCQACFERGRVARAVAMNGDGFVVQGRKPARGLIKTPNLLLRKR